jgi:hypothetical protein
MNAKITAQEDEKKKNNTLSHPVGLLLDLLF